MIHEVIECKAGASNLRDALAKVDRAGKEVVSVVSNQGGPLMALWGSGESFGFLIIVRSRTQSAAQNAC